jgi:hypothetical protein
MFQYRDIWEYLDVSFQEDESFVASTLKMGYGWDYSNLCQQDNRDLMLSVIAKNGELLKYASKRLQNDKELVELSIENYPLAYTYASKRLKNMKSISKKALEQSTSVYSEMSELLKKDRELALIFAKSAFWISIKKLNQEFQADREIMLLAIENHKEALRYADESLKRDKFFIKEALILNPEVYYEL